jgi:AcrR family transcriptional regulator
MAYVKAKVRSGQLVEAARRVLARDGVKGATLRGVASEAGVPLGTLSYVFGSKEQLLKAVIQDVTEEIAEVLAESAQTDRGLEQAIRAGIETFWTRLVADERWLQVMQYELVMYSLRTPGLDHLARWQTERYCRIVAAWCQQAANDAGELCAVPFDALARVMVASVDGIILQFVADPDDARSRRDLAMLTEMLVDLAGIRPAG